MWSLDKVHKVGELLAAVAVVISLIFVGLEIRENTVASQAITYQEAIAFDFNFLTNLGSNPDTARVFYTFRDNPDALTGNEFLQGQALVSAVVRHLENLYLQNQAGMLSDDGWSSREPFIRGFVQTPGFQRVIEGPSGRFYGETFVNYAAQLRADLGEGSEQ
jgi:hypothetical protein